MKNLTSKGKIIVAVALIVAITLSYSSVFAYRYHPNYHWSGGHWWLGNAIVAGLVVGAIVSSLPPRHEIVYAGNANYYYDGTYYYQATPTGYVVVAPPPPASVVVTPAPTPLDSATVIINIPTRAGGYTPITLTKKGDGYIGPQGEYYQGHPTVDQLEALYGK
ncbi:MAG: hypothetical protein PHY31_01675 [Smithellaceae bacterium]|nr:hypothetical protein [Smithellaceae bacterium]